MTLTAFIEGIGLCGPGLAGWAASRAILTGAAPYVPAPTALVPPAALPPSERRRASKAVKVALATGFEAIADAHLDPATLATVFAASSGDGNNCHEISQQLAGPDRQISPTRFHNSVHNAAAGYWSIASGAMASSSVVCAGDGSFGAGLLEAMAQVAVERTRVALIVYDTDYPEPLLGARPVPDSFGFALVLAPGPGPRAVARIEAGLAGGAASAAGVATLPATSLADPTLEVVRTAIPSARGLPLAAAIARLESGPLVLDYLEHVRLALGVTALGPRLGGD